MADEEPFVRLADYPEAVTATGIMVRLVDGLGFRFYWATDGLVEGDYDFRPGSDSKSLRELLEHVWGLVNWVDMAFDGAGDERPEDAEAIRGRVLALLDRLCHVFLTMADADLEAVTINGNPFWHLINGPLADALTHVGQVNTYRRLAGKPPPRLNPFLGVPPRD